MIVAALELARANAALLAVALLAGGGALCMCAPNGRVAWIVAVLAALGACVACAFLGFDGLRLDNEALSGAPWFAVDGIGAFSGLFVAGAVFLTALGAGAFTGREPEAGVRPLVFALTLLAGAGWLGAVYAHDLLGLFLASEVAWAAAIGLVAFGSGRERSALGGALRMVTSGAVFAALAAIGLALIQNGAGTLEVSAIADARVVGPGAAAAGFTCLVLALALKAGAAPMHLWSGAAYSRAGGVAGLALGAVCAVGATAAMIRLSASALAAPGVGEAVGVVLAVLGCAGALIGSVQAVGTRSLMRLGAYAGAAQIGCALLGAALGSTAGYSAALMHVATLSAIMLALMGGAAMLGPGADVSALDGFGRRAPLASMAIATAALCLMGAPLTIGFLSRWRLMEAAVHGGWHWVSGAAIAASLAGVFYGGRLIVRLYFRRAAQAPESASVGAHIVLAPSLAIAALIMLLGAYPAVLLALAERGALLRAGHVL